MVGLQKAPSTTTQSFRDLDYGFYCQSGGKFEVYESGRRRYMDRAKSAATSVRELAITAKGTVQYIVNGRVGYTSKTPITSGEGVHLAVGFHNMYPSQVTDIRAPGTCAGAGGGRLRRQANASSPGPSSFGNSVRATASANQTAATAATFAEEYTPTQLKTMLEAAEADFGDAEEARDAALAEVRLNIEVLEANHTAADADVAFQRARLAAKQVDLEAAVRRNDTAARAAGVGNVPQTFGSAASKSAGASGGGDDGASDVVANVTLVMVAILMVAAVIIAARGVSATAKQNVDYSNSASHDEDEHGYSVERKRSSWDAAANAVASAPTTDMFAWCREESEEGARAIATHGSRKQSFC